MRKINYISSLFYLILLNIVSYTVHAEFSPYLISQAKPHFYIQMDNQSNKDISLNFQPVSGSVSLIPALTSNFLLLAHQQSTKYGVIFDYLGHDDTFNVVFTGQHDCAYNVAFYAVNNPKITISGSGCFGGGYYIEGNTLVLTVLDIN